MNGNESKDTKTRKIFQEFFEKEPRITFSEQENIEFEIAASILLQNKKDCEQFKGRGGI